ncbi:MAG: hypothetical protein ACHBNF_14995 [Chromatiales bacterium]
MDQKDLGEDRYDLGVLLVHGIGQQGKGDTLVRFGDPIQQWLERWISQKSAPGGKKCAPVVDARFAPVGDGAEAPACAELHIRTDMSVDGKPARWLFAESWWASTFLPPSYGELATWGLQILPWTLSTHFATRARRVFHNLHAARGLQRGVVAGRLGLESLGFFLAVLLFPALATLLALVLIVGVLPIPRIRAFAARLQRIVSSTLGDSFVLIASPIQEAAIVGTVERDLCWLAGKRCRRIAVVAHSQGAAIAHAALPRLGPARVDSGSESRRLFVTVGSGLNKLAEIDRIRSSSQPVSVWTAPVGLLVLALALPEVYATFGSENQNFLAWYGALFGLLLFVLGVAAAWRENRPGPEDFAFEGVQWLDFYASADPVPNGRLFDSAEETQRVMQARQVHNLASPLVDHVTYWRSDDDFLAHLVCALGEHGQLKLCEDDSLDRSQLAVAVGRRRWRVRWLLLARLLVAAFTAAIGIRYWNDLPATTQAGLNALAPLFEWLPVVGDQLKPVAELSYASQFVGSAVLALFGLAAYYLLYGAWALWNKRDIADFFSRDPFAPLGESFLGFLFLLVVALEAFILIIAGYGEGLPAGFVAAVMTWAAFMVFFSLLFVLVTGVALQAWAAARATWRGLRALARMIAKQKPANVPPAAATPERASGQRLIAWRAPQYERRFALSFFALILLSFPYQAYVAAGVDSNELWTEGWGWRLRLLNALDQQSNAFTISHSQWLLGAFVLVVGVNVATAIGEFRSLHRRLVRVAHAGPIATAHADRLPAREAIEVLRRRAPLLKEDYAFGESILAELRAGEARAADGKAEVTVTTTSGKPIVIASGSSFEKACAQRLRALAREAGEIAARLPENDSEARDLLQHVAPVSPEAALTLAEHIGRSDPDEARRLLARHADQPSWLPRWRVRRALANMARLGQNARNAA